MNRPYLSFSALTTYEQSEEKFIDRYVYGKKTRITRNIAYGKDVADSLKNYEATGDPFLDLVVAKIPKFEVMDQPIEDKKGVEVYNPHEYKKYRVPALKNGKELIPLMAIPDSIKKDYSAFKEYKTSVRKWTQRMADESGQITFYATAIWLATGKIPEDIELVNVELQYAEDGSLYPTGEIYRFKTKRTMVDIIKMTGRIRSGWKGIKDLMSKELF